MDKRTFLKLLSAAGVAPAAAWTADKPISNWAGNLTYGTTRLREMSNLEQVRAQVRSLSRMKVLGTRHCFNSIADTRDEFLSLKPMHEVVSIDTAARTVTVDAGITYGQLGPYLDGKGYALHNLASLPHISIAGACTTGTHGSGEKNGNLATSVAALELVTASGDVVQLSRKADGETFRGAVVGLGALGVITRLTLDVQPTFQVKQYVYEKLPLAQMRDHFDAIQASGYSVSLFTDWRKQRINELWIKCRVGGAAFAAPAEFYGARRASKNLHPIAELSAENCTEQMGVAGPWYDRLPHFRMGFTPSAGKELQSEFFVPRAKAVDAILAIERLRDRISPHLLISEIRTVAADDLWMSASYQRPSVTIHFTWKPDWPAVRQVLPVIERELSAFQYRPHWGKLFTIAPAELQSRYEKLAEFRKLAARFDPKGKFRNEFLDRNVLGA